MLYPSFVLQPVPQILSNYNLITVRHIIIMQNQIKHFEEIESKNCMEKLMLDPLRTTLPTTE